MIVFGVGSNFTENEKRALEKAFSTGKLVGNELVHVVEERTALVDPLDGFRPQAPTRAPHAGMDHAAKMRAKREARRAR